MISIVYIYHISFRPLFLARYIACVRIVCKYAKSGQTKSSDVDIPINLLSPISNCMYGMDVFVNVEWEVSELQMRPAKVWQRFSIRHIHYPSTELSTPSAARPNLLNALTKIRFTRCLLHSVAIRMLVDPWCVVDSVHVCGLLWHFRIYAQH